MLIDTHCHLDFPDFAEDLDAYVARAEAAGVGRMVTISTRVARFPTYAALAERYASVWCSVGTHPHGAHEELDVTAEQLVELSKHPRCVAIGEAGLDYHYDKSPRDAQAQGLRVHIAAARMTRLPLVIHARQADDDMIAILREEMAKGAFPAILHCFTAGEGLAMAGVEMGLYISFSGILTFKTSEELRRIARLVPRDRLLVETDAPYLAPTPYRGKRNEPAYVVETARVLGDAIGLSFEEVSNLTSDNARRCYWKMDADAPYAAGADARVA
jgi:TatD DNase family protein